MARLLLAFTLIPLVEAWLLLQIGLQLGPMPTLALMLLTGVLGAWFAKREGINVLRQLVAEVQRGIPPGDRLMEGALVLVGGVLLITPGVLTDLTGLLLIVPWTRRWLAPRLLRWASQRFAPHIHVQTMHPPRPQARQPHFDHPVR
jgi:UPF0716 protein FxsA